eukprot:XP_017945733.1 PREDICTED: tolloid-like protein 1 [Xenopus tropicalis]
MSVLPAAMSYSQQPCQYPQHPCQYSQQPCQYSQEPCQYSPLPCHYSQQPRQYSQQPCQHSQQPCQYSQEPCQYSPLPCQYSQQPCQYSQQPRHQTALSLHLQKQGALPQAGRGGDKEETSKENKDEKSGETEPQGKVETISEKINSEKNEESLAPENEYVEKFSQCLNHIPKLRYSLGYDHQKRELCVSFLEVSCGGTLTVPVGISPAPDTQNMSRNLLSVTVPGLYLYPTGVVGYKVRLNALDVRVEYSSSCQYDSIEIRDGTVPTAQQLVKKCGTGDIPTVTSSQNSLLLRFYIDSSNESTGFLAKYSFGKVQSLRAT